MSEEGFSKDEAMGFLGGSISSPLCTVGGEEASHYLALKLFGGQPTIDFERVGGISEIGFKVSEASGHTIDQVTEDIVAAAGPLSVLGISGLAAYHSQEVEDEKSKKFWEGISITSALSPVIYALGDYSEFTGGDFETLSSSLPYEASIPLMLGGAAGIIGYSQADKIKNCVERGKKYFQDFWPTDDERMEFDYQDKSEDIYLEPDPISPEEYGKLIEEIECLKNCEPVTDEWDKHMEEIRSYDINNQILEEAVMIYREEDD
ncbi:MAG: hypothetical protein ACLFS3_01545, partial [Candidatus Aenigmatarchaeota archaeon]